MICFAIFYRWLLLSVNARDTGVFERVLKIDSTKNIVKNLQGMAAGSNIGIERGEILMSVKGLDSLHPMANILIERFVYNTYDTYK